MKRGEPLRRLTPLRAKTPMKRGGTLNRTSKPKAKTSDNAKSNKGLKVLKVQARARDLDTCVRCGVVLHGAGNVHHRRNRGQGGSRTANTIANVITLCGTPVSGCHGDVTLKPWEFHAEANGWVLSTNGVQDPATVPVLVAWLGWAYATADGTWQTIDDIRAVAS